MSTEKRLDLLLGAVMYPSLIIFILSLCYWLYFVFAPFGLKAGLGIYLCITLVSLVMYNTLRYIRFLQLMPDASLKHFWMLSAGETLSLKESTTWVMLYVVGPFMFIPCAYIIIAETRFYKKILARDYIFPTRKNKENELWKTLNGSKCDD